MSRAEAAARTTVDQDTPFSLYVRQKRLTKRDQDALNAVYDGDLSYLDEKVGEVIDHLSREGLIDHTVIIITSDHGEDLGENNLIGHGLHVGHRQLQVPLMIRFPDSFPPGMKIHTRVQLIDLFPTVQDLLRIRSSTAAPQEGISLLKRTDSPQPVISEIFRTLAVNSVFDPRSLRNPIPHMQQLRHKFPGMSEKTVLVGAMKSVYEDPYHFVVSRQGEQLYDVELDPEEIHNLAQNRPGAVARMRRILESRPSIPDPYWGPRFDLSDPSYP